MEHILTVTEIDALLKVYYITQSDLANIIGMSRGMVVSQLRGLYKRQDDFFLKCTEFFYKLESESPRTCAKPSKKNKGVPITTRINIVRSNFFFEITDEF